MRSRTWSYRWLALAGILVALQSVTADAADAAATKKSKRKSESERARVAVSRSVSAVPRSRIVKSSQQIDRLIEADYTQHNVRPNPMTSDEVFLRRIYLAIVGRIPTYDEAIDFLESKDANRRSELIDKLLDSDGYASHQFNYWADLLRVQTRLRYAPSKPYIDFVKDSLRENKPYDQFVRDMITAEGYTWDNGAAGYYLRDTGMPLDNMSNTARVFLGTQLVCAQCHNHPFDSWTQKQYYQLAAFTYGVQTRDRRQEKYLAIRQMQRDGDIDRETMRSASRVLQPLQYRVHEQKRPLKLPKDYQYDDAKPLAVIAPATILGKPISLKEGDSPRDAYARWMTSPDNPRFSKVIANRLWKRTMGIGLIEPVDDFSDGADPSNEALMEFLAKEMVRLKYDMKQFLRVLYNTKTYQRQVSEKEVLADEIYYFPGPVLTRMSAEQLWDSFLALTVPELDERKGANTSYNRYANGKELVEKDLDEVLSMAKTNATARKLQVKYRELTADLQKQSRVAQRTNDRDKLSEIREEMNKIRLKVYGPKGEKQYQRQRRRASKGRRETDPRWTGFAKDLVRASEVSSPARPGHFLRQFGQSDRETIENASTEANVPQILTLLNGPIYGQLSRSNSVLAKAIESRTNSEKIDVLFLSILSRRPTERERELVEKGLESGGRTGVQDVIWSLLNTRQFVFVQ